MEHRISHEEMDTILKQLEDDYVKAVKGNSSRNVEDFIEQFLYDSWDYNDQNIDLIKAVMSRYTQGEIYETTFSGAFNEMVDHLQEKLQQLDEEEIYPMIHTPWGGSFLVSFVDGLVIQYFTGIYSVEDLRKLTPQLKEVILNALCTEKQ
ncbi:hypothetical protein [Halobacillus sp. BBL2006]|uniref:hypothetical protein n=1 Tax=Halobacillus sp. BBL2006 TaxID=1543706 RepID=UPI000543F44C|nr:hypothetical protein [Halobacillus sp. BBL2006]KHE67880.1 hypothetical protein LD39_15795 [Halobacillus sp. BBL2006]